MCMLPGFRNGFHTERKKRVALPFFPGLKVTTFFLDPFSLSSKNPSKIRWAGRHVGVRVLGLLSLGEPRRRSLQCVWVKAQACHDLGGRDTEMVGAAGTTAHLQSPPTFVSLAAQKLSSD